MQFLLKRDRRDSFRYASLQSEFAGSLLRRHNFDPADLDTVYVVTDYDLPTEKLLARSDAIVYTCGQLDGLWRLGSVGRVLPRGLRDFVYQLVARNRYRVFGKYESCMLPEPKHRAKFLDA